jgi:stringent starvation protein B
MGADSALSGKVSSRPFFLWAMVQYLREDNLTPLIVVDAHYPGTIVPESFIEEQTGQITLSLGSMATRNLEPGYRTLRFDAAFPGGVVHHIEVPTLAILAILCQEDATLSMVMGEEERTYGFVDDPDQGADTPLGFGGPSAPSKAKHTAKQKRPSHLRLVTDDEG